MVVTVMKTTFPKSKPKIIYHRAGIKDIEGFRKELRDELRKNETKSYAQFEITFLRLLNKYDPVKQKVLKSQ